MRDVNLWTSVLTSASSSVEDLNVVEEGRPPTQIQSSFRLRQETQGKPREHCVVGEGRKDGKDISAYSTFSLAFSGAMSILVPLLFYSYMAGYGK